ncbi:Protein SIEVE ELEMENT OCCLUSION B [Camellia lanceoleosa]|uniref:Protein SIEVE ELEMENT OCCLUSION B n=1 Tax=Camellia lanceoleosa TaxID=1840588 RepID=A0ACC0J4I6_9ERIC|nr:Protein SIEVE ELEMENT OCCLUSION B [Camellia lanceoleosa]
MEKQLTTTVVEDIFNRAEVTSTEDTLVLRSSKHNVETSETPSASFDDMPEPLAYAIDKISGEFSCKCRDGVDTHATTMSVLKMLTSYSWEAKMVLALAAFAVSYGEFWLIAQFQTSSQLAKSVGVLKQVHFILEKSKISKPQFDEIKSLLKDLLAITKCVVEFKDLSSQYTTTTTDLLDMSTVVSHIATATYWTIRSAEACAFQIASLMGIDHEHRAGAMEGWELPHLARNISNVHNLLSAHLYTFNKCIEEKKQKDIYELLKELFKTTQFDNMTVFKVFFSTRDGLIKLLDGSDARKKIKVNIEVLRAKHVLLLISNLEFSNDELGILERIYTQSKQHQYEIVWVLIIHQDDNYSIGWSDMELKLFEQFRGKMTWYSVEDPSLIQRAMVRYTREVWHFGKNPILVVVDPKGKVTCPNALHRKWIWGSNTFPFSSGDDDLWNKQLWNLEFVVADIDQNITSWITEGKYIWLYGGDDMDWIKQFTTTARDVAQDAGISLEMVYVGKRNSKDKFLRTIRETIGVEK